MSHANSDSDTLKQAGHHPLHRTQIHIGPRLSTMVIKRLNFDAGYFQSLLAYCIILSYFHCAVHFLGTHWELEVNVGRFILGGIVVSIIVFAFANSGCLTGFLDGGNSDNLGLKVAEASSDASAQAEKLISVFDSVNPHSDTLRAAGGNSDASPVPSDGVSGNNSEIAGSSDTAVKDAYNWMVYYATQTGVDSQSNFIAAAESLKEEWEPRYKSARAEYNKLNEQVEASKNTAEEYFTVQKGLTDQIQDPSLKAQYQASDQMEKAVFTKWAEQADRTVLKAYEIMQDLEDMDVIIAKTNLSAHFATLNLSTQTLPTSMLALHEELDHFRQASQEINATFGFDPAESP